MKAIGRLFKKIIGKNNYCSLFHSKVSDKNDNTKWYCNICKIYVQLIDNKTMDGIPLTYAVKNLPF